MKNLGVEEMIKQWIIENIPDFNTTIHTEEDMKIKVLLPYLKSLGYVDEELRFENGIDVQIGTKKTKVYSDIEVIIDLAPFLLKRLGSAPSTLPPASAP